MKNVKHWINPAIRSMQAYHVPSSAGMIKLDAMENPYSWPDFLKPEWHAALDAVALNRYPDAGASGLKEKLRAVMAIPPPTAVLLGNGSDEIIQILAVALGGEGKSWLAPEPAFVMYHQIAQVFGIGYYGVSLAQPDFTLDQNTMLAAIDLHQPALVIIAWPNNPTGNLFDKKVVLEVIRHAPGLVIIDEAYHAFSGQSLVSHLEEFENLLIMRTFSKSGLAGIRLGYLLGPVALLEELEKVRLPYNINSLTQATADFLLAHYNILDEQARCICKSREILFAQLKRMPGFKVWHSAANFILIRSQERTAGEIFAGLRQQGILVKNLHGSHPELENCLRVTVGTDEENQAFLQALEKLV